MKDESLLTSRSLWDQVCALVFSNITTKDAEGLCGLSFHCSIYFHVVMRQIYKMTTSQHVLNAFNNP